MYKDLEECHICDCGKLHEKSITKEVRYENVSRFLENYIIFECDACKEAVANEGSILRGQQALKEIFKEVENV